jgi:hypothetical protein
MKINSFYNDHSYVIIHNEEEKNVIQKLNFSLKTVPIKIKLGLSAPIFTYGSWNWIRILKPDPDLGSKFNEDPCGSGAPCLVMKTI